MFKPDNALITSDSKMSDTILVNPYLLLLLEHFEINVPLGDKTVVQICEEKQINTELFLTFSNLYNGIQYIPKSALTYQDALTIITFLRNSHRFYSEEIYPNVLITIEQMANVNDFKEMALVPKFFVDYFQEVTEHLDYENNVVHPYILDLCELLKNKVHKGIKPKYSVTEYKDHHSDIEEKLDDLKNLLIKYLPQKNDRYIRRKLLFLLSELEFDLNIHSQIEDLILIPLVAEMEVAINQPK
jgi:hypothetical protein